MSVPKSLFDILIASWVLLSCGEPAHSPIESQSSDGVADTETGSGAGTDSLASAGGTESGSDSDTSLVIEGWDPPRNVLLFIGDGMGQAQIDAGSIVKSGEAGTLVFESFPVRGLMTVFAADSDIPDSASSGTALATGVKVSLETIALEIPGDEHELPTILDFYQEQQKSTGIVTTCYVTDATPATFGAHTDDRYDTLDIAWHFLHTAGPTVLFGGGGHGIDYEDATEFGFTVIHSLDGFEDLVNNRIESVSGQFGTEHFPYEADGIGDLPHLTEMTAAALSLLQTNENGWFLMSEGGRIDDAAHVNDIRRVSYEVIALDRAVSDAMAMVDLSDTLIIVTADHATGGLEIVSNNGIGELPDVTWSSQDHDPHPVPFYAAGKGADAFQTLFDQSDGFIDNTTIYHVLTAPPSTDAGSAL